jgi:hypothetical protein
MDRRTTIKWVLAASAAWPLQRPGAAQGVAQGDAPLPARGYGTDPNLATNYRAGGPWPLTMTGPQRRLAGVLSDIIIPADAHSPSAAEVGVVDFIDEWISAPYDAFQRDRGIVLGGFAWLDSDAARRFGKAFVELDTAAHRAICDDICDESRSGIAMGDAARFFALYRDLTAGGFYSSPAGRKDLNYIGNVPLTSFDGPPTALLKTLGLP